MRREDEKETNVGNLDKDELSIFYFHESSINSVINPSRSSTRSIEEEVW
jgi:hypothetical protein